MKTLLIGPEFYLKLHIEMATNDSWSVFFNILSDSHLSCSIRRAHVPDLTKDRPFRAPCSVISAQGPEDTAIRVGVSAIESIRVIELNHDIEGITGRCCPLKDLFPPKHSKVIMNYSFTNQLRLGRIPKCVMGTSGFKVL